MLLSNYYWFGIVLSVLVGLTFIFSCLRSKSKIDYLNVFQTLIIGYLGSSFISFIEIILADINIDWSNLKLGERWSGVVLFATIFFLIKKIDSKLFAVILLGVLLGFPLGKFGCFLSQHYGCYGVETNLPWGVIFNDGIHNSIVKVHPIQLYDALFYFILFLTAFLLYHKHRIFKNLIIYCLSIISLYGFFIEFIRTNDTLLLNLTINQMVYLIIILLVGFYAVKREA